MLNNVRARIAAVNALKDIEIPYPITTFFEKRGRLDLFGMPEKIAEVYCKETAPLSLKEALPYFLHRLSQMICLGAYITAEQVKQGIAFVEPSKLQSLADEVLDVQQPELFRVVFEDYLGDDCISIITNLTTRFSKYVISEDENVLTSEELVSTVFNTGYDIGSTIVLSSPQLEELRWKILYVFDGF